MERQARPLERLKSCFAEFNTRHGMRLLSHSYICSNSCILGFNSSGEPKKRRRSSGNGKASASSPEPASINSTREARYALMLAPPPPGKRPEKYRFDLSMLYTEETGEYCVQEARARSLGLLGKQWVPLPVESLVKSAESSSSRSSLTSYTTGLNDKNNTRTTGIRRKSIMHNEPTVTINTKEALADVFGMYNSPDKTLKFTVLGSKHASVKKIEPFTPVPMSRTASASPQEENDQVDTPGPGKLQNTIMNNTNDQVSLPALRG
jgi:checkpoint serine/threonine-protein kinase